MNVSDFIAKWEKANLTERQSAQEHFLDLCELLGQQKPAEADPTGESFAFERGATKETGGDGFADVWKKGFFGWEYKGRHKDLEAAYQQLLQYRADLQNPPLLVVCDTERFVIRTNFENAPVMKHELRLQDLASPEGFALLRNVFFEPNRLRPGLTIQSITTEAARQLAEIALKMRGRGLPPLDVAHFLDRITFCLFAEDVGLLPKGLFNRVLKNSQHDPAMFRKAVGDLFAAMADGGLFGADKIMHFNGNLFADARVLDLEAEEIARIASISSLDWSAVDPSIIGTLFERGLDPDKRSQLGAHYTSKQDIETLVEPVIMQPLRREWEEVRRIADNLLTTGRKMPVVVAQPPSAGQILGAQAGAPVPQRPVPHRPVPQTAAALAGPASGAYRRDLPHLQRESATLFVTFRTANHLQLPPAARTEVLRHCLHDHNIKAYVHGAVVMPDHVHIVMTPLADSSGKTFSLAEIMNGIKGSSAHTVNELLHRRGPVWQDESFDHILRSDESAQEKVEYLCRNPVRKGIIEDGENYPWLWREWVEGQENAVVAQPPSAGQILGAQAGAPVPQRPVPQKPLAPQAMKKARLETQALVRRFLMDRLANIKVLDPACGSGNFLYVTLQKLKDLEKEVILYAARNGMGGLIPLVGPWQLYGIEINAYACELAQMTVWIGYLQWVRDNGFGGVGEPVLRKLDNIKCMDAILDLTASEPIGVAQSPPAGQTLGAQARAPVPQRHPSEPKEPEWPNVDFIVGNPPFLGGKMLRRGMGDEYVKKLFALWDGRVPAEADLCCYWFEKARHQIESGKCKRAGLLATQGIRGGASREVLKRIKESGDIFFAVSDREWVLDGANVHISIIAFDDGEEKTRTLDGLQVGTINPNLSALTDISQAKRQPANINVGFMGDTKVGPFEMAEDRALAMLASPNPHARPNSDVVRPWVNGLDITRRLQNIWIVDFPPDTTEEEAALYQAPFEYIHEHVKPMRATARSGDRTGVSWWIHQRPRPDMRNAVKELPRFLATANVSKHRLFVWLTTPIIPDHQLIVFSRSDDYFFGVLHSRIHEVWARAQGTQLRERESGFRYTPTTCFETFPLPHPSPEQEKAIAEAAKELDALRNAWLIPPEWTKEEVLEFPGSVNGPWRRYLVGVAQPSLTGQASSVVVAQPPSAGQTSAAQAGAPVPQQLQQPRPQQQNGIVRYPRIVPRDAECAQQLAKRTLTNLYNERPAWLDQAHRKLDAAVFAGYGWDPAMSEEQVLEKLLALNLERAAAGSVNHDGTTSTT